MAAEIWKVRGALVKAVEAVSEQEPVDLVVPINRSAEFVTFVHQVEVETGVQMVAFGHAGDGNVHLCIVRGDRNQETWERELAFVMLFGKNTSIKTLLLQGDIPCPRTQVRR